MKLSKLKEVVLKLEAESTGTDPEVIMYDLTCDDENFDIAEQAEELPASLMRVHDVFIIPMYPLT